MSESKLFRVQFDMMKLRNPKCLSGDQGDMLRSDLPYCQVYMYFDDRLNEIVRAWKTFGFSAMTRILP
jgi:hypothetical protein